MAKFAPKPSEIAFLRQYVQLTDPEEKRKLEEAYDKSIDEYFAYLDALDAEIEASGFDAE